MKKLLYSFLISFTAVIGLTSCAKDFQEDIDKLNDKYDNLDGRVSSLETQVANINDQLKQLSVLATAAENGFYVTDVKTTAGGYRLTLSNGLVFDLQEGPGKSLTSAPIISMITIDGRYCWTVNGMILTDATGLPVPVNGPAPVVRYDDKEQQWVFSVDGGATYQNLNVRASVVINDEVLLQVINNYISSNTTNIFNQEILYQVITTYIQQNYSKIFNVSILRQVVVNYLDEHYTTIFNYDVLQQLFNQYSFEYSAQHIDVDIITNILINFIREHKEVFINNEVLFEIINNYIEVNKIDIFNNELVVEVINNYLETHTDFINIELMTSIVNNYIDAHQEIIITNEVLQTILVEYVQNNYTNLFSQNILYQVLNTYITQNKTTIFNETLIQEILNVYVQNNYNTIINNNILYEIINNYVTLNRTEIFDVDILVKVVNNFFEKNYNVIINENVFRTIINNYISEHQTTIIDIDIVANIVKNYVQKNITSIIDIDVINVLITNYFENNTTIIKQYFSEYAGIISDIKVDSDECVVTLNTGAKISLVVYDEFANVRDRVQSIVLVPNADGHATLYTTADFAKLTYLVSPSNMASVIANNSKRIAMEFLVLGSDGKYSSVPVNKCSGGSDGLLTVYSGTRIASTDAKSIALHVYDNVPGGTDYITSFTPIDWEPKLTVLIQY